MKNIKSIAPLVILLAFGLSFTSCSNNEEKQNYSDIDEAYEAFGDLHLEGKTTTTDVEYVGVDTIPSTYTKCGDSTKIAYNKFKPTMKKMPVTCNEQGRKITKDDIASRLGYEPVTVYVKGDAQNDTFKGSSLDWDTIIKFLVAAAILAFIIWLLFCRCGRDRNSHSSYTESNTTNRTFAGNTPSAPSPTNSGGFTFVQSTRPDLVSSVTNVTITETFANGEKREVTIK